MIFNRFPYPTFRRIRHILIVWAIETIGLIILDEWLPGLVLTSGQSAVVAVAMIGLLNAILRPLFLWLTITITVLTFGLFSFLVNVAVILIASRIVPGFILQDGVTAIWVVLGLTLINLLISNILSLDENDSYYRSVIPRLAITPQHKPKSPGFVIIQIDGLARAVLQEAISLGYMPTVTRWLQINQYTLREWDCGLPSQTSASQIGILYGTNEDIPAFRWYEKENQKLIVSNHLNDTAMLEKRFENYPSLLAESGTSISNMFSGGAEKSVITMSNLADIRWFPKRSGYFLNFFVNPYNFLRVIFLMIREFFRELSQSIWQRLTNVQPRVRRSVLFAIERTLSAVLLRELTTHLVIEDMFHGYQTIYATFVGYDVVAHHTGIHSPASLEVLRGLDKQLERITRASQDSARDYQFIFLSDHGQSQGHTFRQLYGIKLEQFIEMLISENLEVVDSGSSQETKGYVNSLIQSALGPHDRIKKTAKKLYDQIKTGKNDLVYFDLPPRSLAHSAADIVLCASGSLALLYFTNAHARLTLEEIAHQFPGLIEELVSHPGIGFILVKSIQHGGMVIGAGGINYLDLNSITGQNPLKNYGPNAHIHLQRLNQFYHIGDILIQSVYDPFTGQCAAFEDLVGHHGGLGGFQTQAFILHPGEFRWTKEPQNATDMHQILKDWQTELFNKSSS
jgi:putative membrane protein